MRVSATDVDEGENQKITYDLRAEKYPADIEYFRWDEKTGEVWLSKKLDKPVSSVFVLKVSLPLPTTGFDRFSLVIVCHVLGLSCPWVVLSCKVGLCTDNCPLEGLSCLVTNLVKLKSFFILVYIYYSWSLFDFDSHHIFLILI